MRWMVTFMYVQIYLLKIYDDILSFYLNLISGGNIMSENFENYMAVQK